MFRQLELNAVFLSAEIGEAAKFKLLRSIVIKGLEALLVEFESASRGSPFRAEVLESLESSFPGIDWTARLDYVINRVRLHGERRAAEMHEAAAMVAAMGLNPYMSRGAAQRLAEGLPPSHTMVD